MGDFNDYPSNESISKLIEEEKFINCRASYPAGEFCSLFHAFF